MIALICSLLSCIALVLGGNHDSHYYGHNDKYEGHGYGHDDKHDYYGYDKYDDYYGYDKKYDDKYDDYYGYDKKYDKYDYKYDDYYGYDSKYDDKYDYKYDDYYGYYKKENHGHDDKYGYDKKSDYYGYDKKYDDKKDYYNNKKSQHYSSLVQEDVISNAQKNTHIKAVVDPTDDNAAAAIPIVIVVQKTEASAEEVDNVAQLPQVILVVQGANTATATVTAQEYAEDSEVSQVDSAQPIIVVVPQKDNAAVTAQQYDDNTSAPPKIYVVVVPADDSTAVQAQADESVVQSTEPQSTEYNPALQIAVQNLLDTFPEVGAQLTHNRVRNAKKAKKAKKFARNHWRRISFSSTISYN